MPAEPHLHIAAKAGLGGWLRAMAAQETRAAPEQRPHRASPKKRARRRQVRAARRANR